MLLRGASRGRLDDPEVRNRKGTEFGQVMGEAGKLVGIEHLKGGYHCN